MISAVSERDLHPKGRIEERDKNYNFFLRMDTTPYRHEWIAVIDNKVVAHGRKIGVVLKEVERIYPKKNPLIIKVPGKETMIL